MTHTFTGTFAGIQPAQCSFPTDHRQLKRRKNPFQKTSWRGLFTSIANPVLLTFPKKTQLFFKRSVFLHFIPISSTENFSLHYSHASGLPRTLMASELNPGFGSGKGTFIDTASGLYTSFSLAKCRY